MAAATPNVRSQVLNSARRLKRGLQFKASTAGIAGMLSVVLAPGDNPGELDILLRGARASAPASLQVIIAVPDRAAALLKAAALAAKGDAAVSTVRVQGPDAGSAFAAGLAAAQGEFVAFLSAGTRVRGDAYRRAVASLAASGSGIALMPFATRTGLPLFAAPDPTSPAPLTADASGLSLAERPEFAGRLAAEAAVCRTAALRAAPAFTAAPGWVDSAPFAAVLQASPFDALASGGVDMHNGAGYAAVRERSALDAESVGGFVAIVTATAAAYTDAAACASYAESIAGRRLDWYLMSIAELGAPAWQHLVSLAGVLDDALAEPCRDRIELRVRVLLALAAGGNRDLAERLLDRDGWELNEFGGEIVGDRVRASLPLQAELESALPGESFNYTLHETRAEAFFRRARLSGDELAVDFFAHVNHLPAAPGDCVAHLVGSAGERTPLAVAELDEPRAAMGYSRAYANMAAGVRRCVVPAALLSAPGRYTIEVTLTAAELTRTATLAVDRATAFGCPVALPGGALYVSARGDNGGPVELEVFAAGWRAALVPGSIAPDTVTVSLIGGPQGPDPVQLKLRSRVGDRTELTASVTREDDAAPWRATVSLPEQPGPREYAIAVELADGSTVWPTAAEAALAAEPTSAPTAAVAYLGAARPLRGEAEGRAVLTDMRGAALITDVALRGDAIELSVIGTATQLEGACLVSDTQRLPAEASPTGDGRFTLRVPLTGDWWGLGATGAKSGRYDLEAAGVEFAALDSAKLAALPSVEVGERFQLTLAVTDRGLAHLWLAPPLRPEDVGAGNQIRLQRYSRTLAPAQSGRRTVLFRNLFGENANDTSLAVYRELQRRGSDLRLVWSVKDASVWVPEGAETVLEFSREWYEEFGTAHYVIVNMHQPRWHHRPEGQVVVQTFHGYQFKLQGRRWFEALGHDVRRTESLFRRADEWTYLLSPAASSTGPLRESYRSDEDIPSTIIELGYPRNDVLLRDDDEGVRERVRAHLGIRPGVKAILYAPTFRDYLSSDDVSAELVDHLDFERVMRELGPDYVLLMRGHPFNARSGTDGSASYINVTDYPDINPLILASDMAILDYSSLRFDYALTGKPAFFFVPDQERYFATRESFWPYEETAPGPLIATQQELLTSIRRAPEVAAEHEDKRQAFIRNYMEHEDGHAAARFVDEVFGSRGDA